MNAFQKLKEMIGSKPKTFAPIECIWVGYKPEGLLYPGECFWDGYDLSNKYLTQVVAERPPISIAIPIIRDRQYVTDMHGTVLCETFCIDSAPASDPNDNWEVQIHSDLIVGERAQITVFPSIHLIDMWHGWMRAGWLIGGPS